MSSQERRDLNCEWGCGLTLNWNATLELQEINPTHWSCPDIFFTLEAMSWHILYFGWSMFELQEINPTRWSCPDIFFTLDETCLSCKKSIQFVDHEFLLLGNLEGEFSNLMMYNKFML